MKKNLHLSAAVASVRDGPQGSGSGRSRGFIGNLYAGAESSSERPNRAEDREGHPGFADRVERRGLAGRDVHLELLAYVSRALEHVEHNEDYSGGGVVPLIAAYLVWSRREGAGPDADAPCWWGLAVLLIAQAVRYVGVLYAYSSLEHCSLFLCVGGMVLLVLGPAYTKRLKWVLLFLVLMFPLPHRVHDGLALPLQDLATSSALFGLELLGVLVARQGNVLRVGDQTVIAVAEACNGLRMLMAFVVVASTFAFVVRRPIWQKAVLVVSSIPIAILSNTIRLVVTALLFRAASSAATATMFHDVAGIAMMPVAVAAFVGLLIIMRWLFADAGKLPAPVVKAGSDGLHSLARVPRPWLRRWPCWHLPDWGTGSWPGRSMRLGGVRATRAASCVVACSDRLMGGTGHPAGRGDAPHRGRGRFCQPRVPRRGLWPGRRGVRRLHRPATQSHRPSSRFVLSGPRIRRGGLPGNGDSPQKFRDRAGPVVRIHSSGTGRFPQIVLATYAINGQWVNDTGSANAYNVRGPVSLCANWPMSREFKSQQTLQGIAPRTWQHCPVSQRGSSRSPEPATSVTICS